MPFVILTHRQLSRNRGQWGIWHTYEHNVSLHQLDFFMSWWNTPIWGRHFYRWTSAVTRATLWQEGFPLGEKAPSRNGKMNEVQFALAPYRIKSTPLAWHIYALSLSTGAIFPYPLLLLYVNIRLSTHYPQCTGDCSQFQFLLPGVPCPLLPAWKTYDHLSTPLLMSHCVTVSPSVKKPLPLLCSPNTLNILVLEHTQHSVEIICGFVFPTGLGSWIDRMPNFLFSL
jgi:hypothetical protein